MQTLAVIALSSVPSPAARGSTPRQKRRRRNAERVTSFASNCVESRGPDAALETDYTRGVSRSCFAVRCLLHHRRRQKSGGSGSALEAPERVRCIEDNGAACNAPTTFLSRTREGDRVPETTTSDIMGNINPTGTPLTPVVLPHAPAKAMTYERQRASMPLHSNSYSPYCVEGPASVAPPIPGLDKTSKTDSAVMPRILEAAAAAEPTTVTAKGHEEPARFPAPPDFFRFTVAQHQANLTCEDRWFVRHDNSATFANRNGPVVFGVCDGHGGAEAAAWVAEFLPTYILVQTRLKETVSEASAAISAAFIRADEEFKKIVTNKARSLRGRPELCAGCHARHLRDCSLISRGSRSLVVLLLRIWGLPRNSGDDGSCDSDRSYTAPS